MPDALSADQTWTWTARYALRNAALPVGTSANRTCSTILGYGMSCVKMMMRGSRLKKEGGRPRFGDRRSEGRLGNYAPKIEELNGMNAYRNLGIMTAVLVTVLIATCCSSLAPTYTEPDPTFIPVEGLPSVETVDTRAVEYVVFRQDVIDSLATWFTWKTETAFCLGGQMSADSLIVDRVWQSGPPSEPATAIQTEVHCEPYVAQGLIGIGHTHPRSMFVACEPSTTDMRLWWTYPTALIQFVQCGDGWAWMGMRDGRYWRARWR